MFGGIKYEIDNENYSSFIKKETTNELWIYHFDTNKWFLLNSYAKDRQIKNYILPLSVSGHSMHLIERPTFRNQYSSLNTPNRSLLIFFGFSEYYGSTLNIIQEYNLSNLIYFILLKDHSFLKIKKTQKLVSSKGEAKA